MPCFDSRLSKQRREPILLDRGWGFVWYGSRMRSVGVFCCAMTDLLDWPRLFCCSTKRTGALWRVISKCLDITALVERSLLLMMRGRVAAFINPSAKHRRRRVTCITTGSGNPFTMVVSLQGLIWLPELAKCRVDCVYLTRSGFGKSSLSQTLYVGRGLSTKDHQGDGDPWPRALAAANGRARAD